MKLYATNLHKTSQYAIIGIYEKMHQMRDRKTIISLLLR